MRILACAGVMALILATSCSRADRYGTKAKTDEARRELKRDADQAKQKIREGYEETKKEVREGVNDAKNAAHDASRDFKKHSRDTRDHAADPDLSLSWFDATVLTTKAREQVRANQPEPAVGPPRS